MLAPPLKLLGRAWPPLLPTPMINVQKYTVTSISKTAFFSLTLLSTNSSQAYRNMKMTGEPISFTFDPRNMFVVIFTNCLQLCKNCTGLCYGREIEV